MHKEVIKKIRKLRIERGFSLLEMAENLNIDLSAYNRLESGKTLTWAKYLEDVLVILDISVEDFFKGIESKNSLINKKGISTGKLNVENLWVENEEKSKKIEALYVERIKDKDAVIDKLEKIINRFC